MPQITLDLPDDLLQQINQSGSRDRLIELLTLSLQQPAVPAAIYRYIFDFIISNPTAQQIANFCPTAAMRERLSILLDRGQANQLTPLEQSELDEFERIEHLIIMLKSGNFHAFPPVG
ncbi:hypothetical protein C7B65_03190 [Phormidesmis priestleyi ULC007]|uniref:Uncharacterized protein n=1 Tax=Phormidesmis priestleyi ULC007 TaxID=1920490 RepID=A0A2T1DM92_9CYAN|nr:hypothetical protein [Phormidesmis priestleyi]PSB21603.1 hypothetical protein C7B65_03190 [Phormidesmis priestleyi ULC007]PZO54644.1 MAG: hypothetical protein DCF14_01710 [Phormidesmis priestleyi]